MIYIYSQNRSPFSIPPKCSPLFSALTIQCDSVMDQVLRLSYCWSLRMLCIQRACPFQCIVQLQAGSPAASLILFPDPLARNCAQRLVLSGDAWWMCVLVARTSMAEEAVYSDSELELDAASSGISSLSAQQGSRPSTPRFGVRCRPFEVRSKWYWRHICAFLCTSQKSLYIIKCFVTFFGATIR